MAEPSINLRALFKKAWGIARHNFKHDGGCSLRAHFKAALKLCWAYQKRLAVEMAASNARVLAEIERIRALHTPEAAAKRAADMAGFAQRFAPRPNYGRAWR